VKKNIFFGSALVLASCQIAAAQADRGTVCVAARAETPFRGQVIPPTGEISSGGLRVKIDKRPTVPWPQRKSLKIDGLDLNERHLLAVINSAGKSEESVWFRFSEYKSADLCMAYDGYQGIGLQEATRRTPWCKCK
jgi:hypothetical protein